MKTRLFERSFRSLIICLWLGWCGVAHAALPPTITGIWPATPMPGSMTAVFGSNFSLLQGGNRVSFGGVPVPIVQPIDSTLLVFFTPSGVTGGQVCVSTSAGETCLVPPVPVCSGALCVTGIWPGDATAAFTGVVVFGSGFSSSMTITVNGLAVPLAQTLGPDVLFFIMPPGVTSPTKFKICDKSGNCVCWPTGCFIVY